MPFQSTAQQRWAFSTGQPFAKRWAKQTNFKRLPYRKRKKAFTLDQLESFVSSPHYDPSTAGAIASRIPLLPSLKGEQIAPGITRIHGNLCNVHGKYGPCDKGLAGKKPKGSARKPAKPRQTPAQRAQARAQQRDQNAADVAKQMAENDVGLAPAASAALTAFAKGTPPSPEASKGLASLGLAEQAADGSYRMTPTGRAVANAMAAGDYQRAVDGISRATDAHSARQGRQAEHAKRVQDAAGKRAAATMGRELAKRERLAKQQARAAEQAKKKPSGGGGSKKPEAQAVEKPLKVRPTKRLARSSAPSVGGVSGASAPKPKPAPEQAPAKQIAPALQSAADQLSQGAELSEDDTQALIRNGLAKRSKDGTLVLTAAGMRATQKDAASFKVFKDASGRHRWVAQSSTAYQDRDREIVSTKALHDDCAFADTHAAYGPLRWWHCPGLDLGDCDFNAMHGRVLIESGTFRSPLIAQKVAAAAGALEISLGFLHLPTEPDASGVFHHIRRFERSLVPRGKASNRFTAFTVKEITMAEFSPEKIAGMKAIGFTDEQIAEFSHNATSTEKTADGMLIASKADEPEAPLVYAAPDGTQGIIQDGRFVALKAFPPKMDETTTTTTDDVIEEDAMPMEGEAEAEGGLTLSPEDLAAIGEALAGALQGSVAQIMGALDLEKKVAGHVQGLMAPFQAQKDATDAERAEQIATLKAQQDSIQLKLDELLGLQPEVTPRASATPATALNPFNPDDNALLAAVKDQVPVDQQNHVNDFEDLKIKLFGP